MLILLLNFISTNSFAQIYSTINDPQLNAKVNQAMCLVNKSYEKRSPTVYFLTSGSVAISLGYTYAQMKAHDYTEFWLPELKESLEKRFKVFNYDRNIIARVDTRIFQKSKSLIPEPGISLEESLFHYHQNLLSMLYEDAALHQGQFFQTLLELARVTPDLDRLNLGEFFERIEKYFPESKQLYETFYKNLLSLHKEYLGEVNGIDLMDLQELSEKAAMNRLEENEIKKLIDLQTKVSSFDDIVEIENPRIFRVAKQLDAQMVDFAANSGLIKKMMSVSEMALKESTEGEQLFLKTEKSVEIMKQKILQSPDMMEILRENSYAGLSKEADVALDQTNAWKFGAQAAKITAVAMLIVGIYLDVTHQTWARKNLHVDVDHMDAPELRKFFNNPDHGVELTALINHYPPGYEGCNFYQLPTSLKN